VHLSTTDNFYVDTNNPDWRDEDGDGNTTELTYTAFASSTDHITADFVEYTYAQLSTWPNDSNNKVYSQNVINNTTCPSSGGVILYWNAGYNCNNGEGDAGYRQYSGTGVDNNLGTFNDKASSVKIPSGWSVKLSNDSDGNGGSICITSNTDDFGPLGNFPGTSTAINDHVSRAEVFNNSTCSGGPTTGNWSATFYEGHNRWNDPNNGENQRCTKSGSEINASGSLLDHNLGSGSPCQGQMGGDNWVGDYTGNFNFNPGTYVLRVDSDDGVRVWAAGHNGGNPIVDRPGSTSNYIA